MAGSESNLTQARAQFMEHYEQPLRENESWEPVIARKEQIDAEIERLSRLEPPHNGRRCTLITHPQCDPRYPALAPGIQVMLSVLNPGERTQPFRHNATEVSFCIRGSGFVSRQQAVTRFATFDVWTNPSYTYYSHVNDSDDILALLTYSNVPLLQYMQVHIWERGADGRAQEQMDRAEPNSVKRTSPFGTRAIGDSKALLMPYEELINPPVVKSEALHWPWLEVEKELRKLEALGKSYAGRRLYLLYNPATGRTNGTTPSFFATITLRPPGIVDRPHRHVSAAINYYFHGSGRSVVSGKRYNWKAGDLMLSAPGWAIHNHASDDDYVYELTIQDQPLAIAMDALLWQEDLKREAVLLGSQGGFETNRLVAEKAK